ncbi:hypothetical protein [Actinopolymorpha sp. B9G3]|uniref:hypothetical protein n=1 Tax=Actinopolymorpha sp. B9G3 TaxID=3158970 RepID=UPI0032D94E0F
MSTHRVGRSVKVTAFDRGHDGFMFLSGDISLRCSTLDTKEMEVAVGTREGLCDLTVSAQSHQEAMEADVVVTEQPVWRLRSGS